MIAGVSPLVSELKARAEAGRPVTIGLAGCGQMGTDIMVQLNRMPGLRLGAVAEMRPPQARAAAAMAGFTEDHTTYADTPAAIDAASCRDGKVGVGVGGMRISDQTRWFIG